MKKVFFLLVVAFSLCFVSQQAMAQCSICSRTAAQMGEKSALGLNGGIIYLAFVPFAVVGFIAYHWWKRNAQA